MGVISRDDAADEERWIRYGSAPLIATLVLPIVIGVIILLKCVFNHCCVRKTTTKDEMYGLEGRMTMLATADSSFVPLSNNCSVSPIIRRGSGSPPVNVERESSGVTVVANNDVQILPENLTGSLSSDPIEALPGFEDSVQIVNNADRAEYRRSSSSRLTSSQDSSDLAGSLKRASAQHRQLPDLPQIPGQPAQHAPRRSSSVLSHDGTSELYATVGETPVPEGADRPSKRSSHYAQIRDNGTGKTSKGASAAGLQTSNFVNGNPGGSKSGEGRADIGGSGRGIEPTPSSDSETYASTHHPYAKLKKNTEHPYARVRNSGTAENGNDEETDTDNYDLPQFLSRQPGPSSSSQPSTSSAARPPVASQSSGAGVVGSSADAEGPVPPRRIGRQWRRSSQPQVLNDNASHFSGDSQDSRGYTSISVREPLSNIRNQVALTRSYDSHYATVSDDSEEMYAAIDDPNDSNYMRILGEDAQSRRPTWLGGPCVASPIPERREANSPLPPVPNVPPPEISPGPSSVPLPPSSPNSQPAIISTALPVYAQVTKKSKKGKTPVTPTVSNASTSSQQMREVTTTQGGDLSPLPLVNGLLSSSSSAVAKDTTTTLHHHSHSHHHPPPHRSKRAASLMDNTNPMDADSVDSRRWSKADISYSEFEVVRESIFPSNDHLNTGVNVAGTSRVVPDDGSPVPGRQQPLPSDLVDEDNYNIIPDKASLEARRSANSRNDNSSASRRRLDSGNYHVIDPPLNNTYQEIGGCKEPSDHYQEIGDRANLDDDGCDLYQEIERKDRNFEDDEEEEDDDDQFYERVKPNAKKGKKSDQSGKKHGYEKIKRKGGGPSRPGNLSAVIPAIASDEEDEDDDDDKPDQLYESVKYPPYERLKESKDDLLDSHDEEARNGSDSYEDIGYSRVKPKSKGHKPSLSPSTANKQGGNEEHIGEALEEDSVRSDQVDVSQLYARVDKSKKRKGASSSSFTTAVNADNRPTPASDISGNNNDPPGLKNEGDFAANIGQLYSKVTKSNKTNRNTEIKSSSNSGEGDGRGITENESRLDNDNSIEYI